jgi:hypothetical protein
LPLKHPFSFLIHFPIIAKSSNSNSDLKYLHFSNYQDKVQSLIMTFVYYWCLLSSLASSFVTPQQVPCKWPQKTTYMCLKILTTNSALLVDLLLHCHQGQRHGFVLTWILRLSQRAAPQRIQIWLSE